MFGFMKLGNRYNVFGSNLSASLVLLLAVWADGARVAQAASGDINIGSAILSAHETIEVPAPEAGILRELQAVEGTRLKANASIGQVDAREQQLLADVAQQDLLLATKEAASDIRVRLAEKEQGVAEAELVRATSVNNDFPNTVSDKEIDRLQLAVERSKLEIEHAKFERDLLAIRIARIEADLRLAQHRVDRLAIVSPLSGIVTKIYKRPGEWVDKGKSVLQVVRVDRLRVEGFVSVEDAVTGLVGRLVEATATLPTGKPILATGRVVFVSPEAEPVNSQVRFWAEIDNRNLKLRSGLAATLVIRDKKADALPTQASAKHRPAAPTAGTAN